MLKIMPAQSAHPYLQVAVACACGTPCGHVCIDDHAENRSRCMRSCVGTGKSTPFPHSVASSLVDQDMWMIVPPQCTVLLNHLNPLSTDLLPPAV